VVGWVGGPPQKAKIKIGSSKAEKKIRVGPSREVRAAEKLRKKSRGRELGN